MVWTGWHSERAGNVEYGIEAKAADTVSASGPLWEEWSSRDCHLSLCWKVPVASRHAPAASPLTPGIRGEDERETIAATSPPLQKGYTGSEVTRTVHVFSLYKLQVNITVREATPFASEDTKWVVFCSVDSLEPGMPVGDMVKYCEIAQNQGCFRSFTGCKAGRRKWYQAQQQQLSRPGLGISALETPSYLHLSPRDLLADVSCDFDVSETCGHGFCCVQLNILFWNAQRINRRINSVGHSVSRARQQADAGEEESDSTTTPTSEASVDAFPEAVSLPRSDSDINSLFDLFSASFERQLEGVPYTGQPRGGGGGGANSTPTPPARFTSLPEDAVHVVCAFLTKNDFLTFRGTSKRTAKMCKSDAVWLPLLWASAVAHCVPCLGGAGHCLPENIRDEGQKEVVVSFFSFPGDVKGRFLAVSREHMKRAETARKSLERRQSIDKKLTRLEKVAPEVLLPCLVLISVSCLSLAVFALLSVNNTAAYDKVGIGVKGGNTIPPIYWREAANIATIGVVLSIAFLFVGLYYRACLGRDIRIHLMGLLHVSGLLGSALMLLHKATRQLQTPTWAWCVAPLTAGVSLASIVCVYNVMQKTSWVKVCGGGNRGVGPFGKKWPPKLPIF